MRAPTQAETESAAIWRWPFQNTAELRTALEEYSTFLDGTLTRFYGDPLTRGEREIDPGLEIDAARKRSEIDRCMETLEHLYPFYFRALDVHYRGGASMIPRGWTLTAARLGLRKAKCPPAVRCTMVSQKNEPEDNRRELKSCRAMTALACLWDRDTLGVQLTEAVRRLFAVHEGRYGGTP
jgi:hypothetical protein